jgi:molecular chaperone GrpE
MAKKSNKTKKTSIKEEQNSQKQESKTADNKQVVEEAVEQEEIKEVDEVAKLEEDLLDWKNKHHRLYAEFDNYRRRTLKEKADLIKTASESIILELLPVLDDFERAIKAKEEAKDEDMEGIVLIYNKFKTNLEKKGVKKMNAIGDEFNPEIHEAIAQIPAPKKKQKNKILDVIESGYMLHDKVIRFAKVVVGV